MNSQFTTLYTHTHMYMIYCANEMSKMASSNVTTNYESYPPLFRPEAILPSIHGDDDQPTGGGGYLDSDPLPVMDLHRLSHGGERWKLVEACREWGVFRLVNHGIPMGLINGLHEHSKELFSLPFESKQGGPIGYFWGTPALTPPGVAIERGPNDALNVNWVEGFNVPLCQLRSQLLHSQDPVLHTFRHMLDEYGRHQCRIATTIFKAMAENLNLEDQQQQCLCDPTTGLVRVYRYPRCFQPNQAWGMDVHTDSSVLSILNHDQVGGLQVHKDGKWLDVKAIPNSLLVNLGDMMKAMSDDEYKSVKHRVKANKHKERISIGYFVFPAEDDVIRSSKYRPFTYADFRAQVQHDLTTVGFKVGLDRFKLK